MRAKAIVLLVVLVVLAAACGSAESGSGDAPAPADLAADAFAALAEAGSAHYVVDLRVESVNEDRVAPILLHAQGDAPMAGKIIVGPHALFLNFDDRWYGESGTGLAMFFAALARQQEVSADLSSPEGIRSSFDRFFTGDVAAGPETDGVETWQFEGQATPDGLAELENPQDILEGDRARLETLARAVHVSPGQLFTPRSFPRSCSYIGLKRGPISTSESGPV